MKKKSKIILGGCIVVAALIGLSAWKHLESQRQFIHQTQRSVS